MKAFVINLERRKDRYEYVMNNYKSNNYSLEIIKAYDGKEPQNNSEDYEAIKNIFFECIETNLKKNDDYPYKMFSPFKKGEFGCFLSHLIIWKKIIAENIEKAIIFEDDCIFVANFNERLKLLLDEIPSEFNIIWLGGKTCENYESSENIDYSKNISILKEKFPYGAFTYLLSLEGAKKLYYYAHNIFKGKLGVDYFMFDFFKNNNDIQHTAKPHLTWSKLGHDQHNNIFETDIQNE